jgi:hypothetical protein
MRLEPSTYRRTAAARARGAWRRRLYSVAGVFLLATWLFLSYCWVVSYRGAVGIDYSAGATFAHFTFDHAKLWIRYHHERVGEASPVAERNWDVDFWPARRNPGISIFDARPDLTTTDFLFQHMTTADIEGFDPAVFGDVDMRFFELVLPCWLLWTCTSVALMPFLVRYYRERRALRYAGDA